MNGKSQRVAGDEFLRSSDLVFQTCRPPALYRRSILGVGNSQTMGLAWLPLLMIVDEPFADYVASNGAMRRAESPSLFNVQHQHLPQGTEEKPRKSQSR
jgi:hypothetical protein